MQSPNKKPQTAAERRHVARVKALPCGVCGSHPSDDQPSEAHEIVQGLWWLAIPLCAGCHRSGHNGLHGQRAIWNVTKKTELSVLNDTIKALS